MKNHNKCDIIIPIYNAYDCLAECIDSVIENTDLENNGLIIINDKSTDKRVEKLLKKYKKKYPYIKVLENKNNLGFVGTANRGMKLSKNDVLLLNSDTVVTPRWLEKIKECAYSNEMVATVTPLSNNATLASVPNIFEKNDIPKKLSLNEMSKLVEECSYEDYPEIPTAHGFCMFIKRSVLDEVGYFDEEAFGKGYGEENDFCFRCFDYGYRHLLCDNTYIYHKESQSFSNEKYELMEKGEKTLNERYPEYQIKLRDWCFRRPIKYIGGNISFAIGKRLNRKNVLFLIHDWKDVSENVGGTTLHAYDLIKNLRSDYNFHVLAPEDGIYKLYSYWEDTESEIKLHRSVNFKDYGYYNRDYEKMLERIISDFNIEIVHIHHMIGHYFDIANIIKKHELYGILSLHDLYSVCPIINKIFKGQRYCGDSAPEKCKECLKTSIGIRNNMIDVWYKQWKKLFNVVDEIISPSNSAKEEILMTYKKLDIMVVEHGTDLEQVRSDLILEEDGRPYDIAFIGVIVKHKGSEILDYLINHIKPRDIRIHLFGITDIPIRNSRYFVNHGKYKRKDLPNLLKDNNIKLVCLFSMCPESYSYTLTESVVSGVPVVGVNIGAIGERVKKGQLGWLLKFNSEKREYLKKIREIISDPISYNKVIDNINKYNVRSTKEMSMDYKELYANSKRNIQNNQYNKESIKQLIKDSELYFSNSTSPNYPDYSWVFDTLKWKIISRLKIPQFLKDSYSKVKNKLIAYKNEVGKIVSKS